MTAFLKHWPYPVIAILVLAVVLLWNHNQGQRMTIDSQGSIINEQNAEIEYRKTKEGKIIADKVAAEIRAKDLESAYPRLAKVLTEDLDIKLKNLRTSIQAEFRAINSGTSTIIRDTIYREGKTVSVDSVKIDDGYLSLKGEIEPGLFRWKYSYQDSIIVALHVKRKWFLGNEQLYSSAMLSNPNAKVINSTSIHIKSHRDKRWVISVGPYYDPFRDQWGASIQAGFALFKF